MFRPKVYNAGMAAVARSSKPSRHATSHLLMLEGKAVSDLCEQHGLNPSLFYQWQKAFFENGNRAFESGVPGSSGTAEHKLQKQIHALEARLSAGQAAFPQADLEDCVQGASPR
jgi:transposase-like protein